MSERSGRDRVAPTELRTGGHVGAAILGYGAGVLVTRSAGTALMSGDVWEGDTVGWGAMTGVSSQ